MRPSHGARLTFLLGLIGAGLCGYLFYLHLGQLRGEFLGGSICSGSGAFNCHAVTAGRWGAFLGVPLSLWGLIGYLTLITLALVAQQSPERASEVMALAALLATVFVGLDAVLLGIMIRVIRFYCAFCLLTYAVNLLLLAVTWASCGASWSGVVGRAGGAVAALWPFGGRSTAWPAAGMLVLAVGSALGLHAATMFVSEGPMGAARTQMRQFIGAQPRLTVDITGDPMLGPAGAPLRIVEFSDFLCPSCQRAFKVNTIILANHRRDVSFTFKQFPLDMECNATITRSVHPGACRVAAAAECAHAQGKFWAFHDLVFGAFHDGASYNVGGLEADAQRLGLDAARFHACLESGAGMDAVKRDIAEGVKCNVRSTPTYVVNGVPVPGGFSPSTFEDFIAVLRETDH